MDVVVENYSPGVMKRMGFSYPDFQKLNPRFPHESTSDQWFGEQQFESYRALGLHALETICASAGEEEGRERPIADLAELPKGAEVTRESLVEAGLIRSAKGPAKLLANGELTHAVTVRGLKMSASAREKIVAAGGRVEE